MFHTVEKHASSSGDNRTPSETKTHGLSAGGVVEGVGHNSKVRAGEEQTKATHADTLDCRNVDVDTPPESATKKQCILVQRSLPQPDQSLLDAQAGKTAREKSEGPLTLSQKSAPPPGLCKGGARHKAYRVAPRMQVAHLYLRKASFSSSGSASSSDRDPVKSFEHPDRTATPDHSK